MKMTQMMQFENGQQKREQGRLAVSQSVTIHPSKIGFANGEAPALQHWVLRMIRFRTMGWKVMKDVIFVLLLLQMLLLQMLLLLLLIIMINHQSRSLPLLPLPMLLFQLIGSQALHDRCVAGLVGHQREARLIPVALRRAHHVHHCAGAVVERCGADLQGCAAHDFHDK